MPLDTIELESVYTTELAELCKRYSPEWSKWPDEPCTTDIVTHDVIPKEREIRFRIRNPKKPYERPLLKCYDILPLKQQLLVARESRIQFLLPDIKLPLSNDQIRRIDEHPFQVPADWIREHTRENELRFAAYERELLRMQRDERPRHRQDAGPAAAVAAEGQAQPDRKQAVQAGRDIQASEERTIERVRSNHDQVLQFVQQLNEGVEQLDRVAFRNSILDLENRIVRFVPIIRMTVPTAYIRDALVAQSQEDLHQLRHLFNLVTDRQPVPAIVHSMRQ